MNAPRKNSGFALFAVIVILAVVTAAVALSLDEAVASIQSAGRVRVAEIIKGGLDQGLSTALAWVQEQDSADLASVNYETFDANGSVFGALGTPIIAPIDYPPANGATGYDREFRVNIGLRPGQRTRAPEGEDVTKAYGQIVEIQLSIDTSGPNGSALGPAEERVSVGVLVPRTLAHAQ